MQICDWNYCSTYVLFDFLFRKESKCKMKVVERVKGTTGWQLVSQIPYSTIDFVACVTSERRTPITRPIYKEEDILINIHQDGFSAEKWPKNSRNLGDSYDVQTNFGSVSNPGFTSCCYLIKLGKLCVSRKVCREAGTERSYFFRKLRKI